MSNIHEVNEYKCDHCDYKSNNVLNMKKHITLHNTHIRCKTCNHECKDTDELIQHIKENHESNMHKEQVELE